jgi:hypothetical protein
MVGVVTTRHLFTHAAVIVREFGILCLFRCFWRSLTADHAVTFLECAADVVARAPNTRAAADLSEVRVTSLR